MPGVSHLCPWCWVGVLTFMTRPWEASAKEILEWCWCAIAGQTLRYVWGGPVAVGPMSVGDADWCRSWSACACQTLRLEVFKLLGWRVSTWRRTVVNQVVLL